MPGVAGKKALVKIPGGTGRLHERGDDRRRRSPELSNHERDETDLGSRHGAGRQDGRQRHRRVVYVQPADGNGDVRHGERWSRRGHRDRRVPAPRHRGGCVQLQCRAPPRYHRGYRFRFGLHHQGPTRINRRCSTSLAASAAASRRMPPSARPCSPELPSSSSSTAIGRETRTSPSGRSSTRTPFNPPSTGSLTAPSTSKARRTIKASWPRNGFHPLHRFYEQPETEAGRQRRGEDEDRALRRRGRRADRHRSPRADGGRARRRLDRVPPDERGRGRRGRDHDGPGEARPASGDRRCLRPDTHERIFSDEDRDLVAQMDAAFLDPIVNGVSQLSGISAAADKKAEKKLRRTAGFGFRYAVAANSE
jgi:hypothetical protein